MIYLIPGALGQHPHAGDSSSAAQTVTGVSHQTGPSTQTEVFPPFRLESEPVLCSPHTLLSCSRLTPVSHQRHETSASPSPTTSRHASGACLMTALCQEAHPSSTPTHCFCAVFPGHSREKGPFLFTLPGSASRIESVPATRPVRGAQLSECLLVGTRALELGCAPHAALQLFLLGVLSSSGCAWIPLPGTEPEFLVQPQRPARLCSPVSSFSADRTWRHKVHLLRGAAVAQRLLQLQEVLPVAGGPRLPHREGRHPVPRLREGHLSAALASRRPASPRPRVPARGSMEPASSRTRLSSCASQR